MIKSLISNPDWVPSCPGSDVLGPALIHDVEDIVEDAKVFRENSERILAIMQKGKKKTEADNQSDDE